MQGEIDEGEPSVVWQSETEGWLHTLGHYLHLDTGFRGNWYWTAQQTQYPGLDLPHVVEDYGRCSLGC